MTAWLLVVSACLGAPGGAVRGADILFPTIVANLADANATVRTAFVAAAVEAMAAFHETAIRDARRRGGPPDPAWVAATRTYIATLRAARASAERGAVVRFIVDGAGALRVIVGTRPTRQFMLTAPRPHERQQLEHAVATRFCARTGCGGPADAAVVARSSQARARPAAVRVTLGKDDGLQCPGDAAPHPRLQERICADLLAEVRAVAAALRDHARPVDWRVIGAPVRSGAGHVLTVTRSGDAVRLRLPVLFAEPRLLQEALPWMQAVLAGKVTAHAMTPPARMVYDAGLAASEIVR